MTSEHEDRPGQAGAWKPPPADECQEYPPYSTLLGDQGDLIRFRQLWDLRDRLVDFALIQMSPMGGRLRRVAVADICHGELHVHVYNRQEVEIARESVRIVDTQEDVEDSYDAGVDRMFDRWEDYRRRWRRG